MEEQQKLESTPELIAVPKTNPEELVSARERALIAREKRCSEIEALLIARHSPKKFVTLNVGGTKFSTTVATLTTEPASMLGALFSGRFPLETGEDGSIFIDRNGTNFGIILDWLRTRKLSARLHIDVLEALETEADFYQLPGLLSDISVAIFSTKPAHVRRTPVHFRLRLECTTTATAPKLHNVSLKIHSHEPNFVEFFASQSLPSAPGATAPLWNSAGKLFIFQHM